MYSGYACTNMPQNTLSLVLGLVLSFEPADQEQEFPISNLCGAPSRQSSYAATYHESTQPRTRDIHP